MVIDEPFDVDEQIDDDLLLTKTEGSLLMKFNTNICSTQRSVSPALAQQNSANGEFEKRITDIKTKLTQIKNTINNEIENSFTGNQNLNQTETEYNSNNMMMSP